jgi:hypothetical protein
MYAQMCCASIHYGEQQGVAAAMISEQLSGVRIARQPLTPGINRARSDESILRSLDLSSSANRRRAATRYRDRSAVHRN